MYAAPSGERFTVYRRCARDILQGGPGRVEHDELIRRRATRPLLCDDLPYLGVDVIEVDEIGRERVVQLA